MRKLILGLLLVTPSLAFATTCEDKLMGGGLPALLAETICVLAPDSITAVGTVSAEQLTSTDDATIADDLGVTGDVSVGGVLKLDVGTLAAAGSIITDAADIVDQVPYVT